MRALVDVVTSITSSIRFIAALFFLCFFAFGLMVTAGTSYVAPKAAETIADRAERMGDKAIEAAQIEARNAQLGQDGWGYSNEPVQSANGAADAGASQGSFGEDNGGWAD